MEFNVAQLLKEPVGSSRVYPVDATFDRLPETGTDHVSGRVTMIRADKGIWVSGRLETRAVCVCSRCLTTYPHPVRFQLDEVYMPTVDMITGAPLTQPVEDGALTIDHNHTLSLLEAVRQYTILNMPMKPLCRAECPGICQGCGVNLNEGPCQCPASSVDERWTHLLKLMTSNNSQTR